VTETFSGEFNAMGFMDEAIENGVGDGWIVNNFVPAVDQHLERRTFNLHRTRLL